MSALRRLSVQGFSVAAMVMACVAVTAAVPEPGLPLSAAKDFGVASMPLGAVTTMSITLTNISGGTLTGVGYTDTFPAGLQIASPVGLTSPGCTGATITATAGTTTLTMSGASITNATSCILTVNVVGTSAGTKTNTVGLISSSAGTMAGPTGLITIIAPPLVSKAFGTGTMNLGDTTSLTLTLQNFNVSSLTGVGVSDTLPAGLVVATPNGLTNSCGGTATAVAGSGAVSLSGGTLAGSATCTVVANVLAIAPGSQVNTTGAVTSTEGGSGNTATASVVVNAPVPVMGPIVFAFVAIVLGFAAFVMLRRRPGLAG